MIRMSVDLETLGTQPNSLVLAIGLAAICDTRGLIDSKVIYPSRKEQKFRRIDPDTVDWWMGQTREAQRLAFVPEDSQLTIEAAMRSLMGFWQDRGCEEVWGHGPTMDVSILEDLAFDFELHVPWNFRQVRCLRTLAMLAPEVQKVKPWVPHSAQHDAIAQGIWAKEMVQWLKK